MALPLLTALPFLSTMLDKAIDLFDGDDKEQAKILKEQINNNHLQVMAQAEINKAEAVSGKAWRHWVGRVCAVSLGLYFIPQYAIASFMWAVLCWENIYVNNVNTLPPFPVNADALFELVLGMLGLGAIKATEIITGKRNYK